MIVCSGLLHEVTHPENILQSIVKLCENNTVIHINVPNVYSLHRLLGMEIGIIQNVFDKTENNKQFQQNTNFDMQKLEDMVQNSGMDVIEKGGCFIKPFSHKQMQEMLDMKIINEEILEGLYNMTTYIPQFASEIYVNCKIKMMD